MNSNTLMHLALAFALAACNRDANHSTDDDTAACFPGCTCYDGNNGGAFACVDVEPRSRGDYPKKPIENIKAYYGHDNADTEVLDFAITWTAPRFQLEAFGLIVFIDQEKYNPENLPHPAIFYGRSRGILQGGSELREMSTYSGCGLIRIDRLDYDPDTLKASYVKGAIEVANLCHAGTVQGMPPPSEQGLAQELHIDRLEFETDQLEPTLDFSD